MKVILPNGQKVSCSYYSEYEDGTIKSVSTKNQPTIETNIGKIQGITDIEFYPNGLYNIIQFEKEAVITTPLGALKVKRPSIEFYDTGKLKSFILYEPTEIQIPLGKFVANFSIELFENGTIKHITLYQSSLINTPIGKLQVNDFSMNEDETLKSCTLTNPIDIELGNTGIKIKLANTIEFKNEYLIRS